MLRRPPALANSATDGHGNQTHFTYDGLGSTTDLTNGSGAITGTYTYDVFGATLTGPATNQWQYTGEQKDADSGLYFLRARYYDPASGRFLGKDPLPIGNRYSYVGNNPVNYADPYGLFPGIGDIVDCLGDPIECGEEIVEEVVESFIDTFGPPYDLPKILTILDVLPSQLACGAVGFAGGLVAAATAYTVCEFAFGLGAALGTGYLILQSDCDLSVKLLAGGLTIGNLFYDVPGVSLPQEIAQEAALATLTTSLLDCSNDSSEPGESGGSKE